MLCTRVAVIEQTRFNRFTNTAIWDPPQQACRCYEIQNENAQHALQCDLRPGFSVLPSSHASGSIWMKIHELCSNFIEIYSTQGICMSSGDINHTQVESWQQ